MHKLTLALVLGVLAAVAIGGGLAIATSTGPDSGPSKLHQHHPPTKFPGPYEGRHGSKRLGTIVVPAGGAEMYWHGRIAITAQPDLHVTRQIIGQRFVAGGIYRHVYVHATTAHWTIEFRKRLVG